MYTDELASSQRAGVASITFRIFGAILLLLCAAVATSSGQDSETSSTSRLVKSRDTLEAGRVRFKSACSVCHGVTGQGGRGPKLADSPHIRELADKQIIDVVHNGVAGTEMIGFSLTEPQLQELLVFIRSLNLSASEQQAPGDPAAGRSLFFGKEGCSKCHMIAGYGGLLGPDLSSVGANRSLAKLAESIQQPNAYIEPGYRHVVVIARDGRRIEGMAKNDSNYSIQILDRDGNFQLFLKAELQQVTYSRESLMPVPALSVGELENLLAFLSHQARAGISDDLEK